MKRKNKERNAERQRLCTAMRRDCVRVSLPRAFLPTLTLFFHHVADAMAGDDRPDHGLAMMRQGREHYKTPLYLLYGKLKRAEERMDSSHQRKALQLFHRYHDLLEIRNRQFQKRLNMRGRKFRGA